MHTVLEKMKILCKKSKKDMGIILKKQKIFFVIKKPNRMSARQHERAAVRARVCGMAGSLRVVLADTVANRRMVDGSEN